METIEKNRLIAEFMGYEPKTNGIYPIICQNEGKGWHLETMKFHSDWNWLMEVVEKILTVGNDTDQWDNVLNELQSVSIKNVYNACIEFINWYNEKK